MLKNVASRDFSVVVLDFCVIGKLDWFLWMAAIGSVVFSLLYGLGDQTIRQSDRVKLEF